MEDLLYFSFNEKSSVLLIAFVLAMIFGALLLKNGLEANKASSKWLAAFIFLGGLYICPFMCGYAGWYGQDGYREFLYFMPLQQLFLLGPVFYFYVKSLLNSKLQLTRKDLWHFAPAIAYNLYILVVFVVDVLILDEFWFYADGRDMDLDFWYQMAGLLAMLFYLYKTLVLYRRYRRLSAQEVSYADAIAFEWIRNFTIAFALILVLRVLFFILNPEWGQFGNKYWYYLCFSILLVYIAITGYSNTIRAAVQLKPAILPDLEPGANEEPEKPEAESADDKAFDVWKQKIDGLFTAEDISKNPNLTLTDVARMLNTNRNVISGAINQAFNMNFNDFVNEKRAEAVIIQLNNGVHKTTTLLGIALDCGFNSKTTFNRAFKKHTGQTPKQYIADNQL